MESELRSQAMPAASGDTRTHRQSLLPIYCMSLGAFAIGTEGFMIAPL